MITTPLKKSKTIEKKPKWYQAGLAFHCHQCGNCCSGPGEGYVWINKKDIQPIAAYLNLSEDQFLKRFVRKVGKRLSLVEKKPSHDCIFLTRKNSKTTCDIYPHRPVQCRTWPFWPENLKSPDTWNNAAKTCLGINKGPLFSFEKIEALRNGNYESDRLASSSTCTTDPCRKALNWITENTNNQTCLDAMQELYNELDRILATTGGICVQSGRCCRFGQYGHRLYVTTLEMLYFLKTLQTDQVPKPPGYLKSLTDNRCPYQLENLCTVHTFRPIGCRVYFCSGIAQDKQNELTEQFLHRLRGLHDALDVVYHYGDWIDWLKKYNELTTAEPAFLTDLDTHI